jgi:pyrroloquinoline quinone (PQQ) biosynthesis protein C
MSELKAQSGNWLSDLSDKLAAMANAQFESPQFKRLLSIKFTKERAKSYLIQRTHWTLNRRDCWALVQGVAPLDVKRLLWEHEREELAGDQERGVADHHTLSLREGGVLGLAPDDFTRVPPMDGCRTCCYAWRYIASHSHWLGGLAASAALELSNSDEIVKGGSMSRRMAIKFRDELSIPFKDQHSNAEHMEADVRHAHILMDVASKHAKSQWDVDEILKGAEASWSIDRVWKGQLAELLYAIPE